jgi:hypothetical protein
MPNQINVWNKHIEDHIDMIETIQLELEDASYGDHEDHLYLTGTDASGKFIEVIVQKR